MWDEVRAAAEVVRHGTVSAAADALGVHRATINRRIDTLEGYIGGKLFQRHQHGYTPTELGHEVLQVADLASNQLAKLRRRAMNQDVALTGELTITAIDGLIPRILNKVSALTADHPGISVNLISTDALLRLEVGEAHVAFRVGAQPREADYVVLPQEPLQIGLYASAPYIERFGLPTADNLGDHRFVIMSNVDLPSLWLGKLIDEPEIVLKVDTGSTNEMAIMAGVGIGFVPCEVAALNPSLVEVVLPDPSWIVPCWLVTHVDLHRSAKIQALLKYCRPAAQNTHRLVAE
ncbi:MAG: LysR family transcriptional regulator [Pseudomonadota bacterium]